MFILSHAIKVEPHFNIFSGDFLHLIAFHSGLIYNYTEVDDI